METRRKYKATVTTFGPSLYHAARSSQMNVLAGSVRNQALEYTAPKTFRGFDASTIALSALLGSILSVNAVNASMAAASPTAP
jgi:hypothetical protein